MNARVMKGSLGEEVVVDVDDNLWNIVAVGSDGRLALARGYWGYYVSSFFTPNSEPGTGSLEFAGEGDEFVGEPYVPPSDLEAFSSSPTPELPSKRDPTRTRKGRGHEESQAPPAPCTWKVIHTAGWGLRWTLQDQA